MKEKKAIKLLRNAVDFYIREIITTNQNEKREIEIAWEKVVNPSIFTAIVEHKYGTNFYMATSYKKLEKKIAEYCKEWWPELLNPDNYHTGEVPKEISKKCPKDIYERMRLYFEYTDETVDYREPETL